MRALGASAVAATAKARALICEDDARRALADAQIRDICATISEGAFASRRALHYGRAALKRALKALDRNNSSKRERTTRARLAYERIANALFPGRRAGRRCATTSPPPRQPPPPPPPPRRPHGGQSRVKAESIALYARPHVQCRDTRELRFRLLNFILHCRKILM